MVSIERSVNQKVFTVQTFLKGFFIHRFIIGVQPFQTGWNYGTIKRGFILEEKLR